MRMARCSCPYGRLMDDTGAWPAEQDILGLRTESMICGAMNHKIGRNVELSMHYLFYCLEYFMAGTWETSGPTDLYL